MGTIEIISAEQVVHEVLVATDDSLNGLKLYRRFDLRPNKSFKPTFTIDEAGMLVDEGCKIEVCFTQYYKNNNNEIVNTEILPIKEMTYNVVNYPAIYEVDEEGNPTNVLIKPKHTPASNWFKLFSKGGVTIPQGKGIVETVEYTLAMLPIDFVSGNCIPRP